MSEILSYDEYFMNKTIELAKNGIGYTKTNPLVGCVIVKNGEIIGSGAHLMFGENHAEVNAILDAKSKGYDLKSSTLYVNLEPCAHFGKTPPCANRIVEEGISRVVIGTLDPFKKVAGRGVEILKNNNIETTVGVLCKECQKLNERFFTYVKKDRPFIVLKSAMSIDGKIATKTGESKWITSSESREFSHEIRGRLDAIMVGINTVLNDNPMLNVRFGKYKHNPIKIILDSHLKIDINSNILKNNSCSFTIIVTTNNHDNEKLKLLSKMENVRIIICEEKNGFVDLNDLLKRLKEFNISSILVEGGGILQTNLIKEKLVDKFYFFVAPIILGSDAKSAIGDLDIKDLKDKISLKNVQYKEIGGDILIVGRCE